MKHRKELILQGLFCACFMALLFPFLVGAESEVTEPLKLRIGVVLPLSGSLSAYGLNAKSGVELALEILRKDPSYGQTVIPEVVFADGMGSPEESKLALRRLISDHEIDCAIGGISSAVAEVLATVANEEHLPLVSPAASASFLSRSGPYLFRLWPSDKVEANAIAGYLEKNGLDRVGLISIENQYASAMARVLRDRILSTGGEIRWKVYFPENSVDLSKYLTSGTFDQDEEVNAVILISYPRETVSFLRLYRELNVGLPLVATSAFEDSGLLEEVSAEADGVVFSSPQRPRSTERAVRSFFDAYKDKFGVEPGLVADYAFDAFNLLVSASAEAGSNSGMEVRKHLLLVKGYRGASGEINFDSDGGAIREGAMKSVRDGSFVWLD